MNLELYFAPGACSFVPHASLEAITGQLYIGITVARLVALSLVDHASSRKAL